MNHQDQGPDFSGYGMDGAAPVPKPEADQKLTHG